MRPPEFGPGALTRQSQARQRNRTICNFQPSQPPVGREKSHNATQILRAENVLPGPRGNPRNGVRGKRPMDLGGTKWSRSPSDASPGAFCLLFRHGKRRSPPAGGETPLRNDSKRRAESSRPTEEKKISGGGGGMAQASFSCPCGAIHLLAPALQECGEKGEAAKSPANPKIRLRFGI